MRIAIIGAGSVGGALGRRWAEGGHEVRWGVRDPADPKHAALSAAGALHRPAEAAEGAEAIVLATPWEATTSVVASLGPLGGSVLIDATNPIAFGPDGVRLLSLDHPSAAQAVAAAAPGARVVKTLNQVGANVMEAPGPHRPLMLVAGDDAEARALASGLVEALGFEARDAGPLWRAAALEALGMLWIDQAMRGPMGRDFALAVVPTTRAS